jgi:hypothetical protein
VGAFENLKRLPALVGASLSEMPLGKKNSWVDMTCNPPALNECGDATSPKTVMNWLWIYTQKSLTSFYGSKPTHPTSGFFSDTSARRNKLNPKP